jgi:hypothetical protein
MRQREGEGGGMECEGGGVKRSRGSEEEEGG